MGEVRTYEVSVRGFGPHLFNGRSPAKVRAHAYRLYTEMYNATFREFLRMSTIRRVPNPPGVGERILVGGLPATRVLSQGQYVGFMRDDSDVIFLSHPNDVQPMPAQPA